MSWDIFVQDFPAEAKTLEDIPEDFQPQLIGNRTAIIAAILEVVPNANFSDPSWGVIDGDDWSIEINIGKGEDCGGFAFHVRGGGSAVGVVAAILQRLNLRAADCQTGDFFAADERSLESFRQWRQYRDQIVKGT